MAVTLTLNDTEGKIWDLSGANPILSRFPTQTGQGISGGSADAYDGGVVPAVGTDLVNPAAASPGENGREVGSCRVQLESHIHLPARGSVCTCKRVRVGR